MSKWIRKGDQVVVIAGNEKGKVSTVLSRDGDRVMIQGINVRKRHTKSRQKGVPSEIVQIERAIHISNVSICDGEGKPVRLKARVNKDGQKELFYRSGSEEVLYREAKKPAKT